MSIGGQNIEPPIVVIVKKRGTPPQERNGDGADAGRLRDIIEIELPPVKMERA